MPKNIGGIIMLSKIRALKEKKGFTLVELIVVLVILAILAALLVPALTGYIDKAKEKTLIAETRQVVMATQTLVDEAYAKKNVGDGVTVGAKPGTGSTTAAPDVTYEDIAALAEVKGTFTVTMDTTTKYKIATITYTKSGKTCTYTASTGEYDVPKA